MTLTLILPQNVIAGQETIAVKGKYDNGQWNSAIQNGDEFITLLAESGRLSKQEMEEARKETGDNKLRYGCYARLDLRLRFCKTCKCTVYGHMTSSIC